MTEEKALTVKKADAPAEWGARGEIGALADRLAAMLPGADKLERGDFMAIAQYCRLMDLNPFRGDAYFYRDRGKLVVVDGYKVLRRWAERQSPFLERYDVLTPDEMPGEPEGTIGVRCWILRDDRKATLAEFVEMGFTPMDAFRMAAVSAVGVVRPAEYVYKNPPTGWTVEQVARKRAMKNALNLSHGAPSPRESASLSWEVNGVQTIPQDWEQIPEHVQRDGMVEAYAGMSARTRETIAAFNAMTPEEQEAKLAENNALLHGDETDDPFDTSTEPPWTDELTGEYEPPPDFLLVEIPAGDYRGVTMRQLLKDDPAFLAKVANESSSADLRESARKTLTWGAEQAEQEAVE